MRKLRNVVWIGLAQPATWTLCEHLAQGYRLDEHRLAQQGLTELEQAVALLGH